jgi:hypothetical protein
MAQPASSFVDMSCELHSLVTDIAGLPSYMPVNADDQGRPRGVRTRPWSPVAFTLCRR